MLSFRGSFQYIYLQSMLELREWVCTVEWVKLVNNQQVSALEKTKLISLSSNYIKQLMSRWRHSWSLPHTQLLWAVSGRAGSRMCRLQGTSGKLFIASNQIAQKRLVPRPLDVSQRKCVSNGFSLCKRGARVGEKERWGLNLMSFDSVSVVWPKKMIASDEDGEDV